MAIAVEQSIRNPLEEGNPLGWHEIVLNLPGASNFDPSMPWIYKWRQDIKRIAADGVIYIYI